MITLAFWLVCLAIATAAFMVALPVIAACGWVLWKGWPWILGIWLLFRFCV